MKCPQCGTEMRPGLAVVQTKGWLALLSGQWLNSSQHLWFVPHGPDAEAAVAAVAGTGGEVIPKAARPGKSWRCGGCGTAVILGEGTG